MGWQKYPLFRLLLPFVAGMIIADATAALLTQNITILFISLCLCAIALFMQNGRKSRDSFYPKFGIAAMLFFFIFGAALYTLSFNDIRTSLSTDTRQGIVVKNPERKARSWALTMRTDAGARFIAYIDDKSDSTAITGIQIGDTLTFSTRSFSPTCPLDLNEQEQDFAPFRRHLFCSGISATCYIRHDCWSVTPTSASSPNLFTRLRTAMSEAYRNADFTSEEGALIEALTIGDKSRLPQQLKTDYSRAGISHVLALSGFHLAVIFTLLNMMLFAIVLPYRWQWIKSPKTEGDYSNPTIDRITYKKRLPSYRNGGDDSKEGKKAKAAFYPEGGNLICGLESRVAFTLTDTEGYPLSAECLFKDSEGTVLYSASTDSLGRGLAIVRPDGKASVMAVQTDAEKAKWEEFALPEALLSGCALKVQTVEGDIITADISSTADFSGRMLGYAVVNGGNIVECDTFSVSADIMRIDFDRKKLPAGVNQLTVFDSSGRIQAERLFFICPPKDVADSVKLTARTQRLAPCGKVAIDVKTIPDATFSFSAMDNATMVNGKVGNAMTWMLLSSDVKGYIHNPDYYFEADDEEHRRAADLLMMVQGWRRYDWNVMTDRKRLTEKAEMIEDKLYIAGQLKGRKKKHKVGGVEMEAYLFNRKGESLKGETMTDSTGRYAFELPDINGEWNLQIMTRKDNSPLSYFVSIDRHFSPAFRDVSPSEAERIPENGANISFMRNMEQDKKDALAVLQKRDRVLPTIKVKAKRRFTDGARAAWESEKNAQHWASIHYDVDAEVDKMADRGEDMPSFKDWLVAQNPYFSRYHNTWEQRKDECPNYHDLSFKERKMFLKKIKVWNENIEETDEQDFKKSRKTIKGLETGSFQHTGLTVKDPNKIFQKLYYKGQEATIIINNLYYGLPVENNNADILRSLGLNVDDYTVAESKSKEEFPGLINEVKSVYITEHPAATNRYIGKNRTKPTVFIYTHHKFLRDVDGLRRTHFQGYNVPETFEMEDYSIMPPMEDFRRTLYWNPNVKTDKDGKATIEFYNNSSCTQMFISAEGITKDGKFIISEN